MAKSNKARDRISQLVSESIETRKVLELMKDPRISQEPYCFPSGVPGPLTDEQMLVFLLERMGNLAAAVSGADNVAQLEAAMLKVTTFSKIWLENIEGRFHRGR